MAGFDFFRARRGGWTPRTPAAALRAIGAGMVSAEQFINLSTSTKPLDEEPLDFEGIERALARADRAREMNMVLKNVFDGLTRGADPESALLGAEGINALEGRHLDRIGELKKRRPARRVARALAREYYELAFLQGEGGSVRAFYLREAHASLGKARERGRILRSDLVLTVDILVALGLHSQAAARLARIRAHDDPLVLLLSARVAFQRADYRRVRDLCRALAASVPGLDAETASAIVFWTGGVDRA